MAMQGMSRQVNVLPGSKASHIAGACIAFMDSHIHSLLCNCHACLGQGTAFKQGCAALMLLASCRHTWWH